MYVHFLSWSFYCVFCVFCVFIVLSVHFLSSSCLLFVSSGFCIWASLREIKRWNGMELVHNFFQIQNFTASSFSLSPSYSSSSCSNISRFQRLSSCHCSRNTQTHSRLSQQAVQSGCSFYITCQALLLPPGTHHHSHRKSQSCYW